MKSLYEGLLDLDDISANIDKEVVGAWLKDNTQGKYKFTRLKNDAFKFWGNLIIRNALTIPSLNISKLEGSIYIEDCDITSLEGIFSEFCNVTGDISIANCPNLTSLAGLPRYVDGEVSVMDCKLIRSLDGINCLAGDVSLVKCGKRFKKSAVERAFPAAVAIRCSEKDESPNLTEAFSDPILTLLWQQLKDDNRDWSVPKLFTTRNPGMIKPSMCTKFTAMDKDKKDRIKAARRALSDAYAGGFVILEDYDGKFIYLYNSDKYRFDLAHGDNYYSNDKVNLRKITELLADLENKITSGNVKTIYVYEFTNQMWRDSNNIRKARADARAGMIDVRDKESMRIYLREQQKRYKLAVDQLKAARNTEQYKAITSGVEKLMERFTKMMNKTIRDPKWAEQNRIKLEMVYDVFNSHNYNDVLSAFREWSRLIIAKLNGSSTYGSVDRALKNLGDSMIKADERLKDIGM